MTKEVFLCNYNKNVGVIAVLVIIGVVGIVVGVGTCSVGGVVC